MITIRLLAALALIGTLASPVSAGSWIDGTSTFVWNLTVAPPHNEPVIGDKVARYRLQLHPEYATTYFRVSPEINVWGVNTWQPSDVVGHGWEAWQNSDWSVEEFRTSVTTRAEIGPKALHFYTEYYWPIDRKSWGGHGLERHYYWLVGVGGRIK